VIGQGVDPADADDPMAVRAPDRLVPVLAALALVTVVSLVSPVQNSLFDTLARGWLGVACHLAAAASCLWRAWTVRPDRAAWLLFGVGIAAYTAGDAMYLVHLRPLGLPATPSLADPLWGAFYPCAYAATFLLLLRAVRRYHWSAWLDGIAVAAAAVAFARAFVLPPVVAVAHVRESVVAAGLAYPVADLVLLVVAAWATVLAGFRGNAMARLLCAAFACLLAADLGFLHRHAEGAWSLGAVSRIGYPLAMVLIAVAAWCPPRPPEPVTVTDPRVLALPAAVVLVSVGVLATDRFDRLPAEAYWLAAAAVVLAVARVVLYQRAVRPLRESLRRQEHLAEAARLQVAVAALGRRALATAEVLVLFAAAQDTVRSALSVRDCRVAEADADALAAHTVEAVAQVVVGDLRTETRFTCTAPWRSAVAVPVRQRGGCRYALLATHPGRGRFRAADADFLDAAASVLASALDRIEGEEAVRHRSLHDPLTGLANRELCTSHLERAVAHARRTSGVVAVLMLDLDRFKAVNDTLGHGVGDALLEAIGPRLRAAVREDDVVSRFGGDEFVVVCPEVGGDGEAVALAERIRAAVGRPLLLAGHELGIRASIGIATGHGGDPEPETLLRNADLAMYRAKEAGGDRYELFDEDLRARLLGWVGTERALRTAFPGEADEVGAELRLLYQPVVDLSTGRLDRFEALLRWDRPGYGLLAPAAFLGVAEETGLIRPIGDWVFGTVCRQLAAWSAAGHPEVVVAVNISARQVVPGLAQAITDHVAAAGIRRGQLDVELTEHLLMEGPAAAAVVDELRATGVSVTLDGFGTGHSSLGHLRTGSLDAIKLDRAFVQSLDPGSGPAASILHAVTDLGRALGLRVTAEGVEDPYQLALVRQAGCHAAQGHLFAQPMGAEEATALLLSDPPWAYGPESRPPAVLAGD
jgi:diguanylate cyclase (GGDEF)-like protein